MSSHYYSGGVTGNEPSSGFSGLIARMFGFGTAATPATTREERRIIVPIAKLAKQSDIEDAIFRRNEE